MRMDSSDSARGGALPGGERPGGLSPGTLQRLDHVGILVRSADAAIPNLTALLGLSLLHQESLPHLSVHLSYLGIEASISSSPLLQLVQPVGPGPIMEFLDQHGEGLHHICYVVQDVAASVVAVGGTAKSVFTGGRGRRCVFLGQQPHGLLVELTDREARQSDS